MQEPELIRCTIPEALTGWRLDRALANLYPQYSRGQLQSWIHAGRVQVDRQTSSRARRTVRVGEHVHILPVSEPSPLTDLPEPIPLGIVYEDAALLVVDKPAGLTVHPGAGCTAHTLLNALLHHDPSLESLPRAGIVHRLDKHTSGLLLVAKTRKAYTVLVEMLRVRAISREYLAVVLGSPRPQQGRIELPLGRHPVRRTRMTTVTPDRLGRPGVRTARTGYRVRELLGAYSLLQLSLHTGRTHQVRVHLAAIGHPVAGDTVYGGRRAAAHAARQMLHAHALRFTHPHNGDQVQLEAAPPADMQALLAKLRRGTAQAARQAS